MSFLKRLKWAVSLRSAARFSGRTDAERLRIWWVSLNLIEGPLPFLRQAILPGDGAGPRRAERQQLPVDPLNLFFGSL
jgi:hypothetical protein